MESSSNIFSALVLICLGAVALVGIGFIFWNQVQRLLGATKTSEGVPLKTLESFKQVDTPVNEKYIEKKQKLRGRGRSVLHPRPVVVFDPTNVEHQAALWMLMTESRMHSMLRFAHDPSTHDSGYAAALSAMAAHGISATAKEFARKDAEGQARRARISQMPSSKGTRLKSSRKSRKALPKAKAESKSPKKSKAQILTLEPGSNREQAVNKKVS